MNLVRTIEIFSSLVAFDTTSEKSNRPLADYVCDLLDANADEIRLIESENGAKTNVLIRFGPATADRQGLVLSGHMDCVPALEKGWESDPFVLTDREDRWVGRGASDMKGFLALVVSATERIETKQLHHPLYLLFTYDEEVGTLGAKRFVEIFGTEAMLPRSVIIGEPTSLRVARMHKGHLKLRLTTRGRSAHSGYPHLGANAIEPMGEVISRMARLRRELDSERPQHHEHFGAVPFAALNVGTIRGGSAVNIIPDRCEAELGIRLLPGMSTAEMVERVRSAAGDEVELEIISDSPPMLLDTDKAIYRLLAGMVQQNGTATVSFATDAGWLQSLDLDCAIFGPGSIEVAHRPNEFMPKDEFIRAAAIIDDVIARMCGGSR